MIGKEHDDRIVRPTKVALPRAESRGAVSRRGWLTDFTRYALLAVIAVGSAILLRRAPFSCAAGHTRMCGSCFWVRHCPEDAAAQARGAARDGESA
jgi:hypothetical protein